ncbi:MAG: lipoyl synthase [Proteobacteria bacterium]|nr:lipoyl synthase [Pseudomonadota bacterium]MBU1058101.1 lipoyl synthase [Pseudomonadota bacterium]
MKKPPWLRVSLPHGPTYQKLRALIREKHINTVCDKARCPNICECWSNGTATFLILGEICTRNCRFCAIQTGCPTPPDREEPRRVGQAVSALGLRHAVITSVTRDDLVDGGASFFVETVEEIRTLAPACTIEVLIPDFKGNRESLQLILQARPEVIGHNLETVPRLYLRICPGANYRQSLDLLQRAATGTRGMLIKSGLMLGMGESRDEIRMVLTDLREIGCQIVTLGQYLSPGKDHYPVISYVQPETFQQLESEALAMGFLQVEAGPLVRSSYRAEALFSPLSRPVELALE